MVIFSQWNPPQARSRGCKAKMPHLRRQRWAELGPGDPMEPYGQWGFKMDIDLEFNPTNLVGLIQDLSNVSSNIDEFKIGPTDIKWSGSRGFSWLMADDRFKRRCFFGIL